MYYVVTNVGFEDDTEVRFMGDFQTAQLRPHVSKSHQQLEQETSPRKNILKYFSKLNPKQNFNVADIPFFVVEIFLICL